MLLLGIDLGSSSVKTSLVDIVTGQCVSTAQFPKEEMEIIAHKSGWAEQDANIWWKNTKKAIALALQNGKYKPSDIVSIGIAYQMHGLVAIDKNFEPVRPSIIWCDSRAVEIGDNAFKNLGSEYCLNHLLNSPGNFTASKLKWVKENEPDLYAQILKIMLPGDFIAMKLSGLVNTTITGLSEGMFWDFKENKIASKLLEYYGIEENLIPEIVPTFGEQAEVSELGYKETGIPAGVKICYRAGDQPNNAFSLNVLNPGEVAATAGTSGVVYGVSEKVKFDTQSRVNSFAHVNHSTEINRLGVLLCINGTGILNSWLKKNVANNLTYPAMNDLAEKAPIGSDGLVVLPFGNGAERVLSNKEIGASVQNLNFNIHQQAHLIRAAQEGIAFSFQFGLEIMHAMGIETKIIRAAKANMFLSPVFVHAVAGVTGAEIELYETDGSQGAARGAGIGSGFFSNTKEAFEGQKCVQKIKAENQEEYKEAYQLWKETLLAKI